MLIGGLEPSSFVDFPGHVAAVVFCHGCDLRCGYCHNPGLVTRPCGDDAIPVADVLAFLERRRGQLGGVVVSGGEPTLQGDLVAFLQRLRDLGYAVKLDSNGLRPAVLAAAIEREVVDYIAMDLKDLPDAYDHLAGRPIDPEPITASIRLLIDAGIDHEFRTTVCAPRHDRERLARMAEVLRGGRRWILQAFTPGTTLDPWGAWLPPAPQLLADAAAYGNSIGLPTRTRMDTTAWPQPAMSSPATFPTG